MEVLPSSPEQGTEDDRSPALATLSSRDPTASPEAAVIPMLG
jgi:hypothetical protein